MVTTLFGFQIASRDDPLANVKSVRIWVGQLPRNDPVGAVEAIVGLLESTAASPAAATFNRLLAVLELDRTSVPLQAQLRAQYRMAAMSFETRQRLWRAADDLAHWFAHIYEELYEGLRAGNRRARAELHGVFARMFHYVGVQTRQSLFRYEQWIPGRWRLLHSAYREACEQGVVAAPFALDAVTPAAARLSPEQEYLQILMLQRLNTGTLTARQVDWAAEWLQGWATLLRLAMTQNAGEGFWLDLGQGEGLVPRRPDQPVGELLFVDVAPLQAQLRQLRVRLAIQAGANSGEGDFEEQLALARRLEQCWRPDAPALVRRGERLAASLDVTVAKGWTEITSELSALVVRRAVAPQGYHFDDYGRLRPNKSAKAPVAASGKVGGDTWHILDISDSGVRIRAASRQAARQRPGSLLAVRPDEELVWMLGIVRRIKKVSGEQTELGIEIISREPMLVAPREVELQDAGYSVDGVEVGVGGASFMAIYLPPHLHQRAMTPPAMVISPSDYVQGRRVLLMTDGQQREIRLAPPLERTREWVWIPIEAR